jgi:hypothetical protein
LNLEKIPLQKKNKGLATERAPLTIKAKDGTFLEIFEWGSEEA